MGRPYEGKRHLFTDQTTKYQPSFEASCPLLTWGFGLLVHPVPEYTGLMRSILFLHQKEVGLDLLSSPSDTFEKFVLCLHAARVHVQ